MNVKQATIVDNDVDEAHKKYMREYMKLRRKKLQAQKSKHKCAKCDYESVHLDLMLRHFSSKHLDRDEVIRKTA